jgi:hypothetical protein
MRVIGAIAALFLLVPTNLFSLLVVFMIVGGVLYGPDRPSTLLLLIPVAIAYVPLFALNHLARTFVTGGMPAVANIKRFWWPVAFLWWVPVSVGALYAMYRGLGGPVWIVPCEPQECPFGPTTSDIAFAGLYALPFAIPVVHLWLLRRRHSRHAL